MQKPRPRPPPSPPSSRSNKSRPPLPLPHPTPLSSFPILHLMVPYRPQQQDHHYKDDDPDNRSPDHGVRGRRVTLSCVRLGLRRDGGTRRVVVFAGGSSHCWSCHISFSWVFSVTCELVRTFWTEGNWNKTVSVWYSFATLESVISLRTSPNQKAWAERAFHT